MPVRLVLEREGYEVEGAPNRADGMKKLEEIKPDLLILDVMMEEPDDGLRMAREIRKNGNEVPIIMLTSVNAAMGLNIDKDGEIVPVDEFQPSPSSPRRWSPRSRSSSSSRRGLQMATTTLSKTSSEPTSTPWSRSSAPAAARSSRSSRMSRSASTSSTPRPCRPSPTCSTSTPWRSTASRRSTRSCTAPPRGSS